MQIRAVIELGIFEEIYIDGLIEYQRLSFKGIFHESLVIVFIEIFQWFRKNLSLET